MFRISKRFHFCASHRLNNLPEGHKCARDHGHNYVVEIVLEAEELDERGFVVDYGELKKFGQLIDETLDHRSLNDVLAHVVPQPSAEHLAQWLYECAVQMWPQTVAVRVSETPQTEAWYWPPRETLRLKKDSTSY